MKKLLLFLSLLLAINSAWAKIIYVNCNATSSGNGSLATPYKNLQDAFNAAVTNDEVQIAVGTYYTSGSQGFIINNKSGLTVSGGWNAAFNNRTPKATLTVLKGASGLNTSLLFIGNTSVDIKYLTFEGGNNSSPTSGISGGGGVCFAAANGYGFIFNIKYCYFLNNKTNGNGGGFLSDMNTYNGSIMQYCTFEGNTSGVAGGGAFINAAANIANCTFYNNTAGTGGGGICLGAGSATIQQNTIVGNKAQSQSGGLFVANSSACVLVANILAGNTSTNFGDFYRDSGTGYRDDGYNLMTSWGNTGVVATTKYVFPEWLPMILDAKGYVAGSPFTANLLDNGGSVPTIKLISRTLPDTPFAPIDDVPYTITDDWGLRVMELSDAIGNPRPVGNSCIGAMEYYDAGLPSNGLTSVTWTPSLGATVISFNFYKYYKGTRFYNDVWDENSVITCSYDNGATWKDQFIISSTDQTSSRSIGSRTYTIKSIGGAVAEVRDNGVWKTIPNPGSITVTESNQNSPGYYQGEIRWQKGGAETNIIRYASTTAQTYRHTLITNTGISTTTYLGQDMNQTANVVWPSISVNPVWQANGQITLNVTKPDFIPSTTGYTLYCNDEKLADKTFADAPHTYMPDMYKVKKYTIKCSYTPQAGLPPTYNLTSAEAIVKAYIFPQTLNVTFDGCTGKNTINFTVPTLTDVANVESSNFEIIRSDSWDMTVNPKVITSSLAYSASQTSYSFTDPDVNAANTQKTFYYRLRRATQLNSSWGWEFHVGTGSVAYNSTHKQIKVLTATNDSITGKPVLTWTYSDNGVFCAGSKLTIKRSINGAAEVTLTDITDENVKTFKDNSTLTTCVPIQYSITIGSNAHGFTTTAATNSVLVPASAGQQPVLDYLKVSKGFFHDRIELEWYLNKGTLSRFLVKRKLYEEDGKKYVTIADVSITSSKLYKFVDEQCVPSRYYTYQIVAVSSCNGTESEAPLLSDIGFRMPTGAVNGRIVYTGDVPVEGANIIIQGSDQMKNRAVTLSAGNYLSIPDNTNILNPAAFSIQSWLNLDANASADTLLSKGSQFKLLKSGTKLQIKVGSTTKDVTGFVVPLNTYFHISIVEASTTSFVVYINGKAVCTLTGFTAAVQNTNPIVIKSAVTGYIDELRIWSKALTATEVAANYDRYIAGSEDKLKAYYRLDEKINEYIFDISSQNLVFNANHGNIIGTCSRDSANTPTAEQLSLKGKTDANGNYLVAGIPYFGDGTTYTFTPQLGTHEFNPKSRPLFLSEKSAVQNNVDFQDISSFTYEGVVVYKGGTYPVEGVSFLIDDRPALDSKGMYIVTDVDGKYSLSVPIGTHTIKATKMGHIFSAGTVTRNFQANVLFPTGFKFEDATLIKLIGRVVGGKTESGKGLLVGQSKNNIGKATITLEPMKKAKYDMRSTGKTTVDSLIKHDNGTLTRPTIANNTFSILAKQVTINTSAATGEFIAYVYPENYTVSKLILTTPSTDILNGVTSSLYLQNSVNNLYEVSKWTDSITVPATATHKEYKVAKERTDSILYQAKYIQTLIVDPQFSLKETDSIGRVKNYNGVMNYTYNQYATGTSEKIQLVIFTNNSPKYLFGKPIYQQGATYYFKIKAFEKYVNADNGAVDSVPLNGCKVLIDNTLKLSNPNVAETVELDTLGKGSYTFIAGVPDLSTGVKKFDANLSRDNRLFNWDGKFEAFTLGGRSTTEAFTTAGPDRVLAVLRDPPGSNSFSYLEKGTTLSVANSLDQKQMFEMTAKATVKLGADITTFAGLGFGAITEANSTADLTGGLHFTENYDYTKESSIAITTTKRYETSSDPLWVGADADLFIGLSTNFLCGTTTNVSIMKNSAIKNQTKLFEGKDYSIVKTVGMALGESFSTEFAYTARDLENIFIPAWTKLRDNLLLPKGTEVDRTKIKYPVYVSLLDVDDPKYGSKNNDTEVWGKSASELAGQGPSYKIILPSTQTKLTGTDSVSWCNNQIASWKNTLLENEKQKVEATLIKNQSFTSGAMFEYSETTDSTSSTTTTWDYMVSGLVGVETGFDVLGLGLLVSLETETGGGRTTDETTGKETSKTVGFVLQESGDFDALTVDYKSTKDGSISFNTRAGQTSCPYEGATYTKYYTPGTILSEATVKIEVPKISVVNSVANNVPANRDAVFELELKNESEANGDAWYKLMLDGTTNPNGAVLRVDGTTVTEEGRTFLVKAGGVLHKTLTLTKGPNNLDYENIRLILASTCQYDPTDFTEDIYDDVNISAHFIPNCSEISLASPLNNWVMNTETGDSIQVKIQNYDVNFPNFGYIQLQTKASSSSIWNEEMKFYADQTLYNNAVGAKTKLDLGKNGIDYKLKIPAYVDNLYDVRAVAYCVDKTSGITIAQTPTDIASGVKDMIRPQVFGTPQPADGILDAGDEIMIQFNEDIAEGKITQNNITVNGIKNGGQTKHYTSVHFDGQATKMTTEQTINLSGKSFAFEMWMKRAALGAGTILSHSDVNGFELGFTADNKMYVKNGTSSAIVSANSLTDLAEWHHYAMVYDQNFQKISVFVDGDFIGLTDQVFGAYNEDGVLRLGANASETSFVKADIHELRAWGTAVTRDLIQLNKTTSFTGLEKGLIGYWKMNEGKGKVATDKARGRNATIEANWTYSPSGKSVTLTGTNSSVVLNTAQLAIVPESDYSIELWFKGAAQTNACLYSAGRGDGQEFEGSKNKAAIWFDAQGLLNFASNSKTIQFSQLNYLDNQWHHVAVCVNRLSNVNLYIDGSLVNTMDARDLTAINAASTYIGARHYMKTGAYGQFITDNPFNGQIDEVRIWNKNLTETTVQQNMNIRLQGSEAGLQAYYPFDVFSGNDLVYTLKEQTVKPLTTAPIQVAVVQNASESNEAAPVKVDVPADNLGFKFVTNNDKIIITLTDAKNLIERTLVTVSVDGIEDLHENKMASPMSWTAFINRNQLKWEDAETNLTKPVNETFEFKMKVNNTGGVLQNFSINNLPSWLTVSPSSGTIKALSSTEITFSIDKALNPGSYNEMIYLRGGEYDDALTINLNVLSEMPNWTVNPANFSSSMNIISTLKISDVFTTDANDKVAVFVNGECCGVAQPVFYKELNTYLLFMKVYGNENSQNSKLSFKVFDASTGKIYSGKPSTDIVYKDNDLQGNPTSPILITAKDEMYQVIPLNAGWTWISFPLASTNLQTVNNALNGMVASSGDIIKDNAQGWFDSYSATNRSWIGTLSTNGGCSNTSMYMLKAGKAQLLSVAGTVIDVNSKPISVKGGKWNYISYLPMQNVSVKEALAAYTPSANDVLKSQDAFAIYNTTLGWIGDLTYMEPGKGYMLYRSAATDVTFKYPTIVSKKKDFDVPEMYNAYQSGMYAENMSLVAEVNADFMLNSGDWILGYCGNELRSATKMNSNLLFATILGDKSTDIRFELVRNGETIATATESISYESNGIAGNVEEPIVLNFKKVSTAIEKEFNINVYPNPVADKLHVSVSVETQNIASVQRAEIQVMDIYGRNVACNISTIATNYNEFVVNTNSLSCGLYMLKINIDGKVITVKFVKK